MFGLTLWIGKSAAQREAEERRRIAASAEKLLADSEKQKAQEAKDTKATHQATSHSESKTPSKAEDSSALGFDYVGAKAPWRWSDLTPEWGICSTGKRQSPIDISGAKEDQKLKGLKVHYEHDVGIISFKNHTVQISVEPGSWLDFDGERYDLKRVFFRTPGEHRINGLPYELELQLLHQEIGGRVLMLSVQVTRGKSLAELKRITESLPRYEGETNQIERLTWSSFLPSKKTYWFYKGSETFPPCREGVSWLVLTNTMTASSQEIDALAKLQKDNVRPTQPLHGRPITRSNR